MSTEKINKTVDTSKAQEKPDQKNEKKEKSKTKRKPLVKGVKKKKHTHKSTKTSYSTHAGHRLTVNEAKFIDIYIETGNQRQAVIDAGYASKTPGQYGQVLLAKDYIKEEIDWRLQQLEDQKIASAEEILKFYTSVMRGEEKDQFDLEVPMSERLKAANELAKRKIDIVNKVQGGKDTAEVHIKLDWSGMFEGEEEDATEE